MEAGSRSRASPGKGAGSRSCFPWLPGRADMSQHLLVIEDEAGLRDGLKMNFEFEGYRVSAAEDGIAGLELALSLMPARSNEYSIP